jgi:flavin reductase (DIM6/NTAB) family NADH-FMN oxidoreductase RutF
LRKAVFGPAGFRHQCLVGLPDPQRQVSVWLHGLGAPVEVTHRHVIAAAVPLTIGISLESRPALAPKIGCRTSLFFRERGGNRPLLAEIGLKLAAEIPAVEGSLYLFRVTGSKNHCATQAQLWWVYFAAQYHRLFGSGEGRSGIQPTLRDARCAFAFYICPRPIVVVSVKDGSAGNIFPMDLVGSIGPRSFTLALHQSRGGVPLMGRSRQIAVSSVPVEQAPAVYALGENHRKASVDWSDLRFATSLSPAFRLPVPSFALRVREMRITATHTIESYRLFVAEVLEEQVLNSGGLALHIVHGFYDAWRRSENLL